MTDSPEQVAEMQTYYVVKSELTMHFGPAFDRTTTEASKSVVRRLAALTPTNPPREQVGRPDCASCGEPYAEHRRPIVDAGFLWCPGEKIRTYLPTASEQVDDSGLVERLRAMAAMLVHADAQSIKPKKLNEVETTLISTTESRLLWGVMSEAANRITQLSAAPSSGEVEQLRDAVKAAQELLNWTSERASKIAYAQYLESEGQEGKLAPELEALNDAMFDGLLASYRDQFDQALSPPAQEEQS